MRQKKPCRCTAGNAGSFGCGGNNTRQSSASRARPDRRSRSPNLINWRGASLPGKKKALWRPRARLGALIKTTKKTWHGPTWFRNVHAVWSFFKDFLAVLEKNIHDIAAAPAQIAHAEDCQLMWALGRPLGVSNPPARSTPVVAS